MDMLECHPLASRQEPSLSCFFGAFLPYWCFLIRNHDISYPPLKFLLHLYFKKKRFILFLGVCMWVCACECRCLWRPKGVRTSGAGVGYRQLLMWVLDRNVDLMEEQCELL